jgi:hypothetical protein
MNGFGKKYKIVMHYFDTTIPYLAKHNFHMVQQFLIWTSLILLLWLIYALPLFCHW